MKLLRKGFQPWLALWSVTIVNGYTTSSQYSTVTLCVILRVKLRASFSEGVGAKPPSHNADDYYSGFWPATGRTAKSNERRKSFPALSSPSSVVYLDKSPRHFPVVANSPLARRSFYDRFSVASSISTITSRWKWSLEYNQRRPTRPKLHSTVVSFIALQLLCLCSRAAVHGASCPCWHPG